MRARIALSSAVKPMNTQVASIAAPVVARMPSPICHEAGGCCEFSPYAPARGGSVVAAALRERHKHANPYECSDGHTHDDLDEHWKVLPALIVQR